MTGKATRSFRMDYGWIAGLGALLLVNAGVIWNSLRREDPLHQLNSAAIIAAIILGTALVGYLLLFLLYAKRRRRNRALARMGIEVLATVQVNRQFVEALAKIRGDVEPGTGYTDRDFLTWSYSLVDSGMSLAFYDGGREPYVDFEIPHEAVDSIAPSVIQGDPVSFAGLSVNVRKPTGVWSLPLLPVGRGPAGAFSIGGSGVAKLVEDLRAVIPPNDTRVVNGQFD